MGQSVREENNHDATTQSAQPQLLDTQMSTQSKDEFYQNLLESMLRHKRLSAALDLLNEKVTTYRQWTMYHGTRLGGEENPEDYPMGSTTKKKKTQHQAMRTTGNDTIVVAGGRKRGLDLDGHEGESGLFIGSLSGMMPADAYGEGDEKHMDGYNDGDHDDRKKNRPGQRARKAKALAIELRKAGKTWNSSTNWREKKQHNGITDDDGGGGAQNAGGEGRDKYNSTGNSARHKGSNGNVAPKEDIHPSWAAAAQKSKGIAKFQGTKITFD